MAAEPAVAEPDVGRVEVSELLASIDRRIAALGLDLSGLIVVTEAATGAYACTAVIAALAGARVRVRARSTRRHGTAADAVAATLGLAGQAGVADRIVVIEELGRDALSDCDILTNSGHVRPISAEMVGLLPAGAVVALMFEAWEYRESDLDLAACRARGIPVACVNERHPDVAVFPFLGPLCVRLMEDSGLPLGGRVALICDNPFAPYLEDGLRQAGATVATHWSVRSVPAELWETVVVALDPARNAPLGADALAHLTRIAPGVPVVQFWGDVDRAAARSAGLPLVPAHEPAPGHMGILLSALGHEPIVRLQCGGLRAAEMVYRGVPLRSGDVAEVL